MADFDNWMAEVCYIAGCMFGAEVFKWYSFDPELYKEYYECEYSPNAAWDEEVSNWDAE